MSSYKCIRSYPGSPLAGIIIKEQKESYLGNKYWYNNVWFNPEEYPEYWEKISDLIHITSDGVSIYSGQPYYGVTKDFGIFRAIAQSASAVEHHKYFKLFSTEELAKKYIEENKPQFSKKDMIEFANYSTKNFRFDNYPNLDYWINHVRK